MPYSHYCDECHEWVMQCKHDEDIDIKACVELVKTLAAEMSIIELAHIASIMVLDTKNLSRYELVHELAKSIVKGKNNSDDRN